MYRPENIERNLIILSLKNEGIYYKEIAKRVGCSVSVVTRVIMDARREGIIAPIAPNADHAFQTLRTVTGERGGSVAELCKAMGYDAVQWFFKTKPEGVTFAEYVGYIARDVYEDEKEKA
tara:strand:+ start:899 stop:1258 length:360 start_codon:yes stop_codon:yes gene_type:complete